MLPVLQHLVEECLGVFDLYIVIFPFHDRNKFGLDKTHIRRDVQFGVPFQDLLMQGRFNAHAIGFYQVLSGIEIAFGFDPLDLA